MKALQCIELGMPDKLQINEVPDPEVLPGHVDRLLVELPLIAVTLVWRVAASTVVSLVAV